MGELASRIRTKMVLCCHHGLPPLIAVINVLRVADATTFFSQPQSVPEIATPTPLPRSLDLESEVRMETQSCTLGGQAEDANRDESPASFKHNRRLGRQENEQVEQTQKASSKPSSSTSSDNVNISAKQVIEDASHSRTSNSTDKATVVSLPLTTDNIAALSILLVLSILGSVYLWKLCTRKRCQCRLCRGEYLLQKSLGSGGYGTVYVVTRASDKTEFVMKKVPVDDITAADEAQTEARQLRHLRHRFIVSYEDDFVHIEYGRLEPKFHFIIVMEYCPQGDMKLRIEQYIDDNILIPEPLIMQWFLQLCEAVKYIHARGIIHRDIKCQNVFLTEDNKVRLGDFGLCRKALVASASYTQAGTDCYMAPEMLLGKPYGKPADIWTLGCLLYEMSTKQFMWDLPGILGAQVMAQPHLIVELLEKIPPEYSKNLRSIMRRLLAPDPNDRPVIDDLLKKKFIRQFKTINSQPSSSLNRRRSSTAASHSHKSVRSPSAGARHSSHTDSDLVVSDSDD
eukprot:GILK01005027.1.p1 GENE.GILK01005027.1~~GILK01005027.1.p1  ORF type:complete len:512 (-),score=56.89 GILK01005027.1:49-1584(-)